MTFISTSPVYQLKSLGARIWVALAALLLSVGVFGAGVANAAGTVSFTSPPDGSSAPAGTSITPTGIAGITGTAGSGLDLVIVMDSSGSMRSGGRQAAQSAAAKALVDALPAATTSVAIVEFASSSSTVKTLTPLTPATNIAAIKTEIDTVGASGGTNIGSGIDEAVGILNGSGATTGRSKQMVVLSDGSSSGDPGASAAAAFAAGVNNVHSVGLPDHNVATMEDIARNGNGVYTDASDLNTLTGVFDGTGGSLVGVSNIEIILPDGSVITSNSVSGVGAFTVDQAFNIGAGPNTWTVNATFTDGLTSSDTVTVNGTQGVIPLPAGLPLLLGGLGILGVFGARRRKS